MYFQVSRTIKLRLARASHKLIDLYYLSDMSSNSILISHDSEMLLSAYLNEMHILRILRDYLTRNLVIYPINCTFYYHLQSRIYVPNRYRLYTAIGISRAFNNTNTPLPLVLESHTVQAKVLNTRSSYFSSLKRDKYLDSRDCVKKNLDVILVGRLTPSSARFWFDST